tara:strand:- start:177 stop:446 length:270 start_codon:yes stop_codon:yes gene_type:complete
MIDFEQVKRSREKSDKKDLEIVLHYKKIKVDFDKIVESGLDKEINERTKYINICKDLNKSKIPTHNGQKWTTRYVKYIIETLVLYKILR